MAGPFDDLLATIATLRAPGGCPWDRKQTLPDAARYLLDEAGELVDSALAGDHAGVREELADLLFMTCFCCEILGESRPVTMHDVARQGNEKLIRRHPHVFGESVAGSSKAVLRQWEEIKRSEKGHQDEPYLHHVGHGLPALLRASKLQKKAAKVGFDWPDVSGAVPKIAEETAEVLAAADGDDADAVHDELGDLLFAVVNVARHLGVEPESALRAATAKFRQRFEGVERLAAERSIELRDADLATLDALWDEVKATE